MSRFDVAWRLCWSYSMLLCWIPVNVTHIITILATIWILFIYFWTLNNIIFQNCRHLSNQLYSAQTTRDQQYVTSCVKLTTSICATRLIPHYFIDIPHYLEYLLIQWQNTISIWMSYNVWKHYDMVLIQDNFHK